MTGQILFKLRNNLEALLPRPISKLKKWLQAQAKDIDAITDTEDCEMGEGHLRMNLNRHLRDNLLRTEGVRSPLLEQ